MLAALERIERLRQGDVVDAGVAAAGVTRKSAASRLRELRYFGLLWSVQVSGRKDPDVGLTELGRRWLAAIPAGSPA